MYENNTERDRRVNSISNDVSILRRRQIYQYSLEGAWYMIMGLCTMGIILVGYMFNILEVFLI